MERAREKQERGFTMIELMVALTILLIGLMMLLATVVTSVRASSFSRHATEAALLAEDRLEQLRTQAVAAGTIVESNLDEQGFTDTDRGVYTRTSVVTAKALVDGAGNALGNFWEISVTVSWMEQGESTPRTLTLNTERIQ
jgi:prepilin-type N-terminal cleavage/methylation domain-containing protein